MENEENKKCLILKILYRLWNSFREYLNLICSIEFDNLFFFFLYQCNYSDTLYIVEFCPTVKSFHFSKLINDPAVIDYSTRRYTLSLNLARLRGLLYRGSFSGKNFHSSRRKIKVTRETRIIRTRYSQNLIFNFCESRIVSKKIPEGKETNKIIQSSETNIFRKIRNIHTFFPREN